MRPSLTQPRWTTSARQVDDSFDPIELAAKIIALTAALLPPSGILARAIAFQMSFGPEWAIPMAWSAPLPQLAVTGLLSIGLVVPTGFFLWLSWNREVRRHARWRQRLSPQPDRRRGRADWLVELWTSRLVNPLTLAAALALVLFSPAFPTAIVGLPLGALAAIGPLVSWRHRPQRRFRDIWWVVVAVVLVADVTSGILGSSLVGFIQADYEFSPASTTMVNGSYQELGEADGFLYLQKCGTDNIYAVNAGAVASIHERPAQPPLGPSLYETLLGASPLPLGAYKC